jgi:RNA polymerase sigma factor (sigma-70 family)
MSQLEGDGWMRTSMVDGPEQVLGSLEAVATMYAQEAPQVRRRVRRAVDAPEPVIEDACQVAWSRLVRHRARVRRETAVTWVIRSAVHEAFRLTRRSGREVSLDELAEEVDLPAPRLLEDLAEQRARLDGLRILPERQRRLVWLRGLGLSYGEIAGETGDSKRTVERQLNHARQRLARAEV